MEKNEHVIFADIPNEGRGGKFHSAVLSTYAIDLVHFDRHMLNVLRRKQICSVNIFADFDQLVKAVEFANPLFVDSVGKDYSIVGIECIGAFHPKINFFVGDDAVLVVLGTGNLTVPGHGKNHEAFTGFMIDGTDETQRPLIEECWRYLTQFASQCSKFEKNRILHELPDNCRYLDNNYHLSPHQLHDVYNELQAALLYNDESSSILSQIANIVPLDKVEKVTIVSPFFDEKGESLVTFSELCPKAKIEILMQEGCSLPPCKMPDIKSIAFYNFNETSRGKTALSIYDRQLHAKIFHFKSADTEYCLVGSANATLAGLGTIDKRGINDEFCVLYVSKHKDFLNELGLKTRKKLFKKVKEMTREVTISDNDTEKKYKIYSAQYENGKLMVVCYEQVPESTQIVIDYGHTSILQKITTKNDYQYTIECSIGKNPAICYLVDATSECISNKLFVDKIEQLETTNPSQTSRNLNRFISRIENEGYEGLEVADMLSDIMWDLVCDNDENKRITISSSSKIHEKSDALPEIKYNKDYDNDEMNRHSSLQIDKSSRLIECIEESIKRKIRSIDEAINDEEEEGSAEYSNERNVGVSNDIPVNVKHIKGFASLSDSVLEKYVKLLNKRSEQVEKSDDKTITRDDLNFFSLSIFASIEICYLNRSRYKFDVTDSISKSNYQKRLYENLDRSICLKGLNAIESFLKFCTSMNRPNITEDLKKKANRTAKYAILYGTLFFKNATQNEEQILGNKILNALRGIISYIGMPSTEYLKEELMLISERYDYSFREIHIERFLKRLNN